MIHLVHGENTVAVTDWEDKLRWTFADTQSAIRFAKQRERLHIRYRARVDPNRLRELLAQRPKPPFQFSGRLVRVDLRRREWK